MSEQFLSSRHHQTAGTVHSPTLVFAGKNCLVCVGHSQDAAFFNFEQCPGIDYGITTGIRSHFHQFVLSHELLLQRGRLGVGVCHCED